VPVAAPELLSAAAVALNTDADFALAVALQAEYDAEAARQ
jgi:hypothetical protein